jgi:hypothetical protein
MVSPETAKPATAIAANGLRIVEQLGGRLDLTDNRNLQLVYDKLQRRFGLSPATAVVVAELALFASCSR